MKTIYRILIVIIMTGFAGCTKFVQVGLPKINLVTASVFSNNSSATAAQVGIYSGMANNGESANMAIELGLLSDELTDYDPSANYLPFYINALYATLGLGPWPNAYNYIYQANAVMEGIKNNSGLNPAVVQQLTGEDKFVRAFWYFYLTNIYGDVPLALNTDYATNALLTRTPRSDVYQQILTDLKDAEGTLNSNYVDATDTNVSIIDRNRPTKWAAKALLARTYLYTGDYADAESEADSVIGNTGLYSLCPNLNNVFLVNSPEAIWQLGIPQPNGINTLDGVDFILISEPPSSNCCSLSPQLLNSFEPGDNRRINWVDSFVTTSIPPLVYDFAYKYKVNYSSTEIEDVMVLRLAEQYLIRSEARAKQGNISGATDDLNVIRNRAGLPNYSGANDQASLLSAILHERQVELFTEWGHRWLDLIRTGNVNAVMSVVTPLKGGIWSTDGHQLLFPIPQPDRIADPNLTQNPGY